MKFELHHKRDLSLSQIIKIAHKKATVSLSEETKSLLQERRNQIENFLAEQDIPAYGFNRGFGHNVDLPVDQDLLSVSQENLILSHAVGLGDTMPVYIIRVVMLLRAKSLAKGNSGIRPIIVERLLTFLKEDIVPLVPELGSVGASGDLAPLSHIALCLIGKGKVMYKGQEKRTEEVLKELKIAPLVLQMKEGLALTNGIQFMTAIGLYSCYQMNSMLKQAAINTAMTAQVMLAPETPYREDLHQLRPHPGAVKLSRWITELMKNSPLRESHRDTNIDGEIQDPYNLRCAGQILGACAELIDECETTLIREANSVTDNPILIEATEKGNLSSEILSKYSGQYVDVVSGGHFHGMPVAIRIFGLFQAMGIMASLVNQRCVRFVDEKRNKGLGRDLKWPELNKKMAAISSGMMLPEYASAAIANSIWGECMPNHLFSISTNSGQEDHVSMGASLAVRLFKTLPRLGDLLGIELAYISQSAAIRRELAFIPTRSPVPESIKQSLKDQITEMKDKQNPFVMELEFVEHYPVEPEGRMLNSVGERVLDKVKKIFPPVKKDRYMSEELRSLSHAVFKGDFVKVVEEIFQLE